MKIIQLVTQMEAGGAQRVAYLLKNELAHRGHNSRLCFLYTKRPAYASAADVSSLMGHPPSLIDYCKIVVRLFRMISAEKPDVLITHTHFANILGHIVSSALGVGSRIAVQHNPVETYPRGARLADYLIGSLGFYSTSVAVSETVARSVARYPRSYRKRLATVYNGVPEPASYASREVTRTRWNIPLDAALLVNVGRLSLQKNQEFLIRLLQMDEGLRLLIVGDGELREWLHGLAAQLQVSDRVYFTGEVSPEDVCSLISASDIFALPSHFEAVGMVMLEAMLVGTPVISNDIPSGREFLAEEGVLVGTEFPEKWLAAIQTLLCNREMASGMAARAKIKAQNFTVPRMGDAYEALFLPAVATRPAIDGETVVRQGAG